MGLETWKRAQNLQVVTLAEGALLAKLLDFQFDLHDHHIYGWCLKTAGVFSKIGGVRADHLTLVGRDVAFVRAEADVDWDMGKAGHVDGRAWASTYQGAGVMSRRGEALGAVQDFVIDRQGDRVTGLLLHGGRLVPLDDAVRTGPTAVIVPSRDKVVELDEGGPHPEDERGWWKRLQESLGGARSDQEDER